MCLLFIIPNFSFTYSCLLALLVKPPKISSQPNDVLDIVPGEQAVMKVLASGYYIKYQWRRNGRAIQGETSNSYCTTMVRGWIKGAATVYISRVP